ncbi:MEDS domain-containing protein [Caenispirillum salinarum]|uniref:MEDS domain-containing protein n=1 Tax=Caenispirillum salinarum TaxID=859058 RepID=UPI0038510948
MSGHAAFSIESIQPGTHVCYLYDSRDQRMDAIGRIMAGVLANGGSTDYFACETELDLIHDHLVQRGIPRDLLAEPHFHFRDARSTYAPGGRFDPAAMLSTLRHGYAEMRGRVTGTVFFTGEMDWSLDPALPGVDKLVAYERQVNAVVADSPFSAICQYDARLFDGELLFQILKAHPLMLVRNQIVPNPYYDPPTGSDALACCDGHAHGHA